MRDLTNQSRIWKFVGSVSAINGLVCFALSSTYKMSFGKWGFRGLLAYLLAGLITLFLMLRAKRIRVSQKVQVVVAALIVDVICLISVLHDKLVAGKSDALSIISYASFALMSLSMSRKFELGFETGFSSLFLSLFVAHLCKINWNLLPVALVFCSVLIILRHYSESETQDSPGTGQVSESGVQPGSITPNGYHPVEVAVIEIGDENINEESQDSPVSGQSLSSWINEQNNQGESYQAMHHSPSYGQVSEGGILDGPSFAECLSTCLLCLAVSYPYYIMPSESSDFVYLVVIYLSIFIIIWRFVLWCKSFRIPKKFHGLVAVLFFVVICFICDKLVTGKSDAFSIISYGSFALMSLSMSRKSELGFKKGFFPCLLSLFVEQVSKIMWILSPIAAVSGQSLLSRNNQRNNQEESPQAMHHSTSNGEVLEGSMLDLDNLQNNEQEEDESSDQYHVSSGNNMLTIQNGWMHSSGDPALISSAPPLDCGGGTQLNVWRFQVSDGTHSINPRLMCDPVRRIWLCLEEAELVFRMVEEADLELTMRPEMRILVKPQAADSADDLRTSSPTSVLQLRADAEAEEEEEEEETVEKCQDVTRT